jgi:hypothetical protein
VPRARKSFRYTVFNTWKKETGTFCLTPFRFPEENSSEPFCFVDPPSLRTSEHRRTAVGEERHTTPAIRPPRKGPKRLPDCVSGPVQEGFGGPTCRGGL